MDRLIALVVLRVKEELRAIGFARERLLGLLIAVPGLLLSSLLLSGLAFVGLRALERASPETTPTVVAAAAGALGLAWAFSPILTGVAFAASHDMSRLLHFPIPLGTLVASSLIANFTQPMTLAELPVLLAAAAALAPGPALPLALAGFVLSLALALAAAQLVGLALHGLARRRRWRDLALFAGLGFGFLISALPLLVILAGARGLRVLYALALAFEWLPFGWGARAAVHAGRGELLPFAGFAGAAALALLLALAASAGLIRLIYRGELDLGGVARGAGRPARMPLPGDLGALLEKDLRSAWRDPGLRATLVLGMVGPLLVLFFLTQSGVTARTGPAVLLLASFVGLSAFGSNALGFERRGLGLLLGFPVARWRVLAGKNLAALLLRVPGLLTLALAALVAAPLALAPAAFTIAAASFLIAVGVDNFFAILFPIAAPAPGKNPYAQASGGRGLGTAFVSAGFLMGAAMLAAPFALLAWLPLLLGAQALWLLALPLALAGAGAVYAMLVAGAGRLLERREPELLERVLGEAE